LIFRTLPIAFGHMPGGVIFGTAFFLLLVFAAWTSAISIIEPFVAYLVENRGMTRVQAAAWAGLGTWVVGIGTVLSFNVWSQPWAFGKTFFDLIDYLTSNILLPLGGLLIALFAGWLMSKRSVRDELGLEAGWFAVWLLVLRYVAPVAVLIVFLNAVGLI
jgi:NSS family neurotransmitter:Na+ symporter